MRLTSRKSDNSSLSSLPSASRFSRQRRDSRSATATDTDTLITLSRNSFSRSDSPEQHLQKPSDMVSMSQTAQKIIPATLKLTALQPHNAVTSCDHAPAQPFDQAGGHHGTFQHDGDGATLVKQVTDREASFYEFAQQGLWPQRLLPKFYGRTPGGDAIKIENLTYGFQRPCVMDLKMGQQTVEDTESNIIKKLKMTALDVVTKTKSAGVRLEGLSMHRALDQRRIKGTKAQSHSLSVRVSLQDVITFFLTDESGVRTDLALRFQTAIETILRQFQNNRRYRFIGSSILLIYDNDNSAPRMRWARALRKLHTINPKARLSEDQISGLTRKTKCDVRMIDFAHTGPMPEGMEQDEGYITGLKTILKALKAIRVYRAKPIFSVANAVVDVMEEQRALSSRYSQNQGSESNVGEFTFSTLLGELTPLENNQVVEENEEIAT